MQMITREVKRQMKTNVLRPSVPGMLFRFEMQFVNSGKIKISMEEAQLIENYVDSKEEHQ